MLTRLSHDELMSIGARVQAERLLAQADYTLKTAAKEGSLLRGILPEGYLDEVKKTFEGLARAQRVDAIEEAERKQIDDVLAQAFHEAKVWRRKVAHRAQQAVHLGAPVKEEIFRIQEARTPRTLVQNIRQMIELLEPHLAELPGEDWREVFEQGSRLAETLDATVAPSENHLRKLPDSLRNYYAAKGQLYMALKVINDAGWAIHSDSSTEASKFNLETLHRPVREMH